MSLIAASSDDREMLTVEDGTAGVMSRPKKGHFQGAPRTIYERPALQSRETLNGFLDRLLSHKWDAPVGMDWRISRLKEFIDSDAGKIGLDVDALCQRLGLGISCRQARRLFKRDIGMGIREYAKKRRLANAAQRLQTTSVPVKVIAADLGYQSATNFIRRFKKVFHLSPTEFRTVRHTVAT